MAARPLTLADLIEALADSVPERIAIHTMDRTYTFAEIDQRSTRLANHLVGAGVKPGDHVAVHSHNCIEWVDAFYGVLKARAVPININYKYLQTELEHLYADSGAVAAIDEANAEIAKDPLKAAKDYVAATNEKTPPETLVEIMKEPGTNFSTTPYGIMLQARHFYAMKTIKAEPKDWKDTFFPIVHCVVSFWARRAVMSLKQP